MKIAYFDTIAGISGDMTLGAFISAGLPLDVLQNEIQKLNLKGVEIQASHVVRNGINAVHFDVVVSEQQHHHRSLSHINSLIDKSTLSERVKSNAKNIFLELAKAEAKVHNTSIEKIHFHEVGALDSIVDIVGAAICFEKFGIEKIYSSPIKLGSGGFVNSAHGQLPVPTPATVEILKNYSTVLTTIPHELTTPTGAAIIKAMSSGVLSAEQINIESIGYGAGTKEIESVPNLLRVFVGELSPNYEHDELVMIETNIDDMNPEIYPYVIERLFSVGVHDAYIVPIIMKKGRPGVLLSVLTSRAKIDDATKILFTETTTLGARIIPIQRKKIIRGQKEIKTTVGTVKVKSVIRGGNEQLVPEFEECKRIAVETKLSLVDVYKILERELSQK
jgi:uncharacterized protein (TIGR00299 family) protein